VLISLVYVLLRRVLQLVILLGRSRDFKELEIVVLRHELGILRRRTTRPPMTSRRPTAPGRREPLIAADGVAFVRGHASDAAPLASADRGLAMDIRGPQRTATDSTRPARADCASRPRQSAMGVTIKNRCGGSGRGGICVGGWARCDIGPPPQSVRFSRSRFQKRLSSPSEGSNALCHSPVCCSPCDFLWRWKRRGDSTNSPSAELPRPMDWRLQHHWL
jgi:hypothetical protein